MARSAPSATDPRVELPKAVDGGPLGKILLRVAFAIGLVVFVTVVAYLGRTGYEDGAGDEVTLLDAFYYATVSITTTGYGDITPVTDTARLTTALLVTPARVLFLILLVGTTLEYLVGRSREAYRRTRWRSTLKDHVIVCGFGTKGRSAIKTLLAKGVERGEIVVLTPDADSRGVATAHGFAAVAGDATTTEALEEAGVREARSIVVAVDRDDTAVLATLTARELNPTATIVAAVREEENVHLLHQSGATSVITSSGAAGRLLGHAVDEPRVTEVLEDLITVGQGLDVVERPVSDEEAGPFSALRCEGPVIGLIRDEEILRFDDPRVKTVVPGDCVVYLRSHRI